MGGGPAPGINGVIAAATVEATKRGWAVVGIVEGFRHLGRGKPVTRALDLDELQAVHMRGGSILKTSRDNPAREGPEAWTRVLHSFEELGLDALLTIGGEGTMSAAAQIARETRLKVVHVPKTIDNDLPLPAHLDTFGFQTARHVGTRIVHDLIEDARATDRWYVVVTMGREAGHLALGIGKAAGAAVTVLPEEFPPGKIPLARVADVVEGAIVKRRARGVQHGVAVLAEGLSARLDASEVAREEYKGVSVSESNLALLVRDELRRRFAERRLPVNVMAKEIGYELRAADPIPLDAALTRDLGYAAVRFLADGGSAAVVTVDGGRLVPIPFADVIDPSTKRSRLRFVDTTSAAYQVAWEYQERLKAHDLADPARVKTLAAAAGLEPEAFVARFAAVVEPSTPPSVRRT